MPIKSVRATSSGISIVLVAPVGSLSGIGTGTSRPIGGTSVPSKLNVAMRVCQSPEAGMYSLVCQKVQPSLGSTLMAL